MSQTDLELRIFLLGLLSSWIVAKHCHAETDAVLTCGIIIILQQIY